MVFISSVSDGQGIFGERNTEVAITMFEMQHVCNDYYDQWAGLEKSPSADCVDEGRDT